MQAEALVGYVNAYQINNNIVYIENLCPILFEIVLCVAKAVTYCCGSPSHGTAGSYRHVTRTAG